MPSLADTIQQNQGVLTRDANGQLTTQSPEEVQKLAQKAGLTSPPVTPLGTAAVGGTPKQQDMAGSSAQKQAALNIAQQPSQNLAAAERTQQVRTQADQSEQAEMNKSQALKDLGQVGDRVGDLINAQKAKLEAAAGTTPVAVQGATTIQNAAGANLTSDQATAIQPALAALRANPNDMNAMLQVNQALGYDANTQLSPDQINSLYQNSNDAIAAAGANTAQSNATVNDLIQNGLPYTTDQLSQLLGVPADQVATMNVGQIRDTVNKLMADEFSKTSGLQQKAQSGELGTAERALAQQGAREASATGLRSSEADVQNLKQSLDRGDTVSFNGQQMTVEQALSNDNISKTISDYLNAAPGSPERAQLDKSEPQLSDFINKNQAVLSDAADKLKAGATQFSTIQTNNKQAVESVLPPDVVPADVLKALVPQYGEMSASQLDPSQVPILAAAQNLSDADKKQYANSITNMTQQFPEVTDQLKGLSADQIQQLGLNDPNGKWSTYVQQAQDYKQLQSASNVDDIITKLYGTDANFQQDLAQNQSNIILGVGHHNPSLDTIDANHDGQVDTLDQIKSRLNMTQPSLQDILAGKQDVPGQQQYSATDGPDKWDNSMQSDELAGDKNAIKSGLQDALGKYTSDGNLSGDEVTKAYHNISDSNTKPNALQSDIQELTYLRDNGTLDAGTKKTVSDLLSQAQNRMGNSSMGDLFGDVKDYSPISGYNNVTMTSYWQPKLDALMKQYNNDPSQMPSGVSSTYSTINTLLDRIKRNAPAKAIDAAESDLKDAYEKYKNNSGMS